MQTTAKSQTPRLLLWHSAKSRADEVVNCTSVLWSWIKVKSKVYLALGLQPFKQTPAEVTEWLQHESRGTGWRSGTDSALNCKAWEAPPSPQLPPAAPFAASGKPLLAYLMFMIGYQLSSSPSSLGGRVLLGPELSSLCLSVTRELCHPSGSEEVWNMLLAMSPVTLVTGAWNTT